MISEREDHAINSRGGHTADPAISRTFRSAAAGGSARDGSRGPGDKPAAGDGGASGPDDALRAESSQPRRTVGRQRSAASVTRGRLPAHHGRAPRLARRAPSAVRRSSMLGVAVQRRYPSLTIGPDFPLSHGRALRAKAPPRRAALDFQSFRAAHKQAASPSHHGPAACQSSAARRPVLATIFGHLSRPERRGP